MNDTVKTFEKLLLLRWSYYGGSDHTLYFYKHGYSGTLKRSEQTKVLGFGKGPEFELVIQSGAYRVLELYKPIVQSDLQVLWSEITTRIDEAEKKQQQRRESEFADWLNSL